MKKKNICKLTELSLDPYVILILSVFQMIFDIVNTSKNDIICLWIVTQILLCPNIKTN